MTSLEFPFCRSNEHSINTTGRSTDSCTKRKRIDRYRSPEQTNTEEQQQQRSGDRMVNFTAAARDVETGLGQESVVLVEKKSSTGWMGKLLLAMFLVVACCAGALLLVWHWNGRQELQAVPGETEALMERKTTEPHYTVSRLSNKSTAAIHLEGSLQDGEHGKEELVWKNDQGQAFTQGGFKLEDNTIDIPANGLYFVYSQASFRVSCGDGDKEERGSTPLSHRVWRHSDSLGGRATLLTAVRSACQLTAQEGGHSEGGGWYNTIYLGAVFQLKAGDKLSTETNQLSQLETDEGKNFFGVFAL